MRFNQKFLLFISLFITSLTLIGSHTTTWARDKGTPLPSFNIPTLKEGQRLTNKTFLGHVSLLNVWASWCGYCKTEHKMLLKISQQYHVPVYGLDFKDNPEAANDWLKTAGNPYVSVGVDESGSVGEQLGVSGTPKTYIIDKHGRIRYEYTGGIEQSTWNQELAPLVKKYQSEK